MNSNGHPRFFPASRTDEYPDFPASTFVPDPSQYGLGHTTYAHTLAQPPMSASLDPLPLLEMTGDNNYPDAQHWVGWQPSTGYQPTWRGSDVGSVRPPLEAHKHGDTGDSRSEEPLGVGKRKAGRPRMSSVSVDNASQEERRRFHGN
ncbi:hypothetical protein I302_102988 [Kwoniella bestiolae CBS 10118]|uniref:Uncharacterized protein n=1 Tax=Kwoniella bestiolae CBS 10118 TaxID=1296100 RepID=A0A1B9GGR9_9TREE|nr:hypothetical protein I302_01684 [Kwoniella bestiolae CBS 10118]OCF30165.1 hypothetical protein I302_01684 [Kwoniella bestiolae CBS 10118]